MINTNNFLIKLTLVLFPFPSGLFLSLCFVGVGCVLVCVGGKHTKRKKKKNLPELIMDILSVVILSLFGLFTLNFYFLHGHYFLLVITFMSFLFAFLSRQDDEPTEDDEPTKESNPIQTPLPPANKPSPPLIPTPSSFRDMPPSHHWFSQTQAESSEARISVQVLQNKQSIGFLATKTSGEFEVVERYVPDAKFHFAKCTKVVSRYGADKVVYGLRNLKTNRYLHRSHMGDRCNSAGRFRYHEFIGMESSRWLMFKNFFSCPSSFYMDSRRHLCVGPTDHPLQFLTHNV